MTEGPIYPDNDDDMEGGSSHRLFTLVLASLAY